MGFTVQVCLQGTWPLAASTIQLHQRLVVASCHCQSKTFYVTNCHIVLSRNSSAVLVKGPKNQGIYSIKIPTVTGYQKSSTALYRPQYPASQPSPHEGATSAARMMVFQCVRSHTLNRMISTISKVLHKVYKVSWESWLMESSWVMMTHGCARKAMTSTS